METKAEKRKVSKLRARVKRTLKAANDIDGRGMVLAVVWGIQFAGRDQTDHGVAVRQMQYSMDSVGFHILSDGKWLKFLGKLRLILK